MGGEEPPGPGTGSHRPSALSIVQRQHRTLSLTLMEIELENPFGLHAPARLRLDPRLDVAAVLERARQEHGLDCQRLLYRGRLLKTSDVIGQFIEPDQTIKILTHVSDRSFRAMSPNGGSPRNPSESPARDIPRRVANPPAAAGPPRPGIWQQFREYLDLSLLGRLAFFIIILGGDAGPSRRVALFTIALIIYIYQIFIRPGPIPENDLIQGPAIPRAENHASRLEPDQLGLVQLTERFLVGLFASLYPGWDPN